MENKNELWCVCLVTSFIDTEVSITNNGSAMFYFISAERLGYNGLYCISDEATEAIAARTTKILKEKGVEEISLLYRGSHTERKGMIIAAIEESGVKIVQNKDMTPKPHSSDHSIKSKVLVNPIGHGPVTPAAN